MAQIYRREVDDHLRTLFARSSAHVQWDGLFDKWGGKVAYSESVRIEPHTLQAGTSGHLYAIGAFSYVQSALPTDTQIGRYCSIARGVSALGEGHPIDHFSTSPVFYKPRLYPFAADEATYRLSQFRKKEWHAESTRSPIRIGNDVWIGRAAVLKDGVSIGHGSIVAQGALVTKDVPPYAIVGGIPARVIRFRFPESTVERLLRSQWWQYAYTDFAGIATDDRPEDFVDDLEKLVASGRLEPYAPPAIEFADFQQLL